MTEAAETAALPTPEWRISPGLTGYPQALAAMEARFAALAGAGLWQSQSNSRAMGVA